MKEEKVKENELREGKRDNKMKKERVKKEKGKVRRKDEEIYSFLFLSVQIGCSRIN